MLKQLLQLLLETFLKSKKEWIGRQSYPSNRVTLSTSLTEYIPPSDGFIAVYKSTENKNTAYDLYSFGSSGSILGRSTLSIPDGTFAYCAMFPVRKGYKVIISGKGSELWFTPCQGSIS